MEFKIDKRIAVELMESQENSADPGKKIIPVMTGLFAAYMFLLMMSLVFIQKQIIFVTDDLGFQKNYYLDMAVLAAGFAAAGFYKKIMKT